MTTAVSLALEPLPGSVIGGWCICCGVGGLIRVLSVSRRWRYRSIYNAKYRNFLSFRELQNHKVWAIRSSELTTCLMRSNARPEPSQSSDPYGGLTVTPMTDMLRSCVQQQSGCLIEIKRKHSCANEIRCFSYVLWMKLKISCASWETPMPTVCRCSSKAASAQRSLSSRTFVLHGGNVMSKA